VIIAAEIQDVYLFDGNGTKGYSWDDSPAVEAELYAPDQISGSISGNIYIADGGWYYNSVTYCSVRMVNSSGIIATVAGNRLWILTMVMVVLQHKHS
jgi:hypothetical protein